MADAAKLQLNEPTNVGRRRLTFSKKEVRVSFSSLRLVPIVPRNEFRNENKQKTAIRQSFIMKLQDGCDESAAAQVWSDHFDQAKTHLDRPLPDHYNSTCEDIDLCEKNDNVELLMKMIVTVAEEDLLQPSPGVAAIATVEEGVAGENSLQEHLTGFIVEYPVNSVAENDMPATDSDGKSCPTSTTHTQQNWEVVFQKTKEKYERLFNNRHRAVCSNNPVSTVETTVSQRFYRFFRTCCCCDHRK